HGDFGAFVNLLQACTLVMTNLWQTCTLVMTNLWQACCKLKLLSGLPQRLRRKAFFGLPHRQGLNDKSAKPFPRKPFRKPFRKIDVGKLFMNHLSDKV
ncbi:hypothetical protein AVEN_22303-1, partial [Araneus ventricosus]